MLPIIFKTKTTKVSLLITKYHAFAIVMVLMLAASTSLGVALATIDSPKKQLEAGVAPENIVCREGLILAIIRDNVPVCIKQTTAQILQERLNVTITIPEPTPQPPQPEKAQPEKTQPEVQSQPTSTPTEQKSTGAAAIGGTTGKANAKIENIPASGGSVANFYITDDDLNTSPNGVDIIRTAGLVEFTINGVTVQGPDTMIETGPNTGIFYVRLVLPDTVNGQPLSQNDVIQVIYHDQSDASGQGRAVSSSLPLSKTYAQLSTSGGGQRIGHDFTVTIYEPDANLDSDQVDRISLSAIEFKADGGIKTTLANPAFDANPSYLLETGKNTGTFSVVIKIPRTIDGKVMDIGASYEMTYIDTTTPSDTSEKIVLKGKIG